MNAHRRRSVSRWAVVAVVVLGLLFGYHHLVDPDLFQQLAVGRSIVDDPGSLGLSGYHALFPDYHYLEDKWLGSVLLSLLDRAGGEDALMLCQLLLNVLLGLAWFRLFRLGGGGPAAAVAGTALTFAACAFRTELRPDTLSLVLLSWTSGLFLQKFIPMRSILIWALTILLWVNLHGYFINGFLVLLAAAVAALCGADVPLFSGAGKKEVVRRAGRFLAVGLAVGCIHPQGPRALTWPLRQLLELWAGDAMRSAILEFAPSWVLFAGLRWWHGAALVLAVLTGIGSRAVMGRTVRAGLMFFMASILGSLWLLAPPDGMRQWPYRITMFLVTAALLRLPDQVRRRNWYPVFLFTGFAVLAAPLIRNQALLPPFAVLLAFRPLRPGDQKAGASGRFHPEGRLVTVMATVLFMLVAWFRWADYLPPGKYTAPGWTGWGIARNSIPVAAVDFFEEAGLPGPVLNHFDNGGYLLYRLYPRHRVFMAGNTSMYPSSFLERYRREVVEGSISAGRLAEKYKFQTAIIDHSTLEAGGTVTRLQRSRGWRLIWFDRVAAIWAVHGAAPEFPELDVDHRYLELEQERVEGQDGSARRPGGRRKIYPALNMARFLIRLDRADLALREISRLRDQGPAAQLREAMARGHYYRAVELLEQGEPEQARGELMQAVTLSPSEPGPWIALARIEAESGNRELALIRLREGLRRMPDDHQRDMILADPVLGKVLRENQSNP